MPQFSERIGAKSSPTSIQLEGMSEALRNSLWNLIYHLYEADYFHDRVYWYKVAVHVARYFLKVPVDEVPNDDYESCIYIKKNFYQLKWYEVYDLIEFIAEHYKVIVGNRYHPTKREQYEQEVNRILQAELSGYRFIAGVLSPISDEVEIKEIEEAAEKSSQLGLEGVREHIRTALDNLGKKPAPDYRNAIKEAISAVESVARQLSGEKDLGAALEKLSKQINIHGALKSGFTKLYGYSSDEDGIRHAILEQTSVGFDEAKYMIVACSAFVNFLISKANEASLLKL
jgi:hypothetical protein